MNYDENRSTGESQRASKETKTLGKTITTNAIKLYLCTDLVSALSGLDMHNFTHFDSENTA